MMQHSYDESIDMMGGSDESETSSSSGEEQQHKIHAPTPVRPPSAVASAMGRPPSARPMMPSMPMPRPPSGFGATPSSPFHSGMGPGPGPHPTLRPHQLFSRSGLTLDDDEELGISDESNDISSFLEEDDDEDILLGPSHLYPTSHDYESWIEAASNQEVPCPYKAFSTPPLHDEEGMKSYLRLKDMWELQLDMKRDRLGDFVRKNCLKPGVHDSFAAYNEEDYAHLKVNKEVRDLFKYISLPIIPEDGKNPEPRMRPFIPDYYPSVGDVDAFLKVMDPGVRDDSRDGFEALDEPSLLQSDPSILDLQLRSIAKMRSLKAAVVKKVDEADGKNRHVVERWINDIVNIHKTKPSPSVHYSKPMPDIDSLLEEWPPEVEGALKPPHPLTLPSPDFDVDLKTYVDIVCGILDVPVYKSRVQSLHLLFSLFNSFKECKGMMDWLNSEQEALEEEPKVSLTSTASEEHDNYFDSAGVINSLKID